MSDVRISEIIAPAFAAVHRSIKSREHTHYWLKGGRGSTKSSFAAIQTVLAIIRDPQINAVVVRKVANTLRDSVYAQVLWAIEVLGVSAHFHSSVSPMEIVYKPTGQRIMFRGADKPEKLKSIKTRTGYIGLVWYEELDQFFGMNEIRNINQSLMRGGEFFTALYTYNPPRSRDSWVNRELTTHRDDRYIHSSTYLEVPRHWLGELFIAEAETLRELNEAAYNHEYLGDVTGTGGAVFENVELRAITDEEIEQFDRIYNGVDFGYFPDPWVYERMHYDSARMTLYVFAEATAIRASNAETAALIRTHLGEVLDERGEVKVRHSNELVVCDSAEPKSIRDYRDEGIDARPVPKGKGSVEYSMKWLASRARIVIDSARCPLAGTEFPLYEYERTRDGEYTTGYPDVNNHSIDAARYGMAPVIQRGGK